MLLPEVISAPERLEPGDFVRDSGFDVYDEEGKRRLSLIVCRVRSRRETPCWPITDVLQDGATVPDQTQSDVLGSPRLVPVGVRQNPDPGHLPQAGHVTGPMTKRCS